jgi:phenylacetate-coenzyme A ligase PaaK-like adenylate-forming protein
MSDTIKQRVDTQTLVNEINTYEPDYLYNHKNLLMRIAKYVKENDIYMWKPSFYTPFGEMLDDPSRELLQEVFGPGLIDAYGMGETGSCVVRIPGKKYYQVNSDLFVVNVYNQDLTGPALKGMAVITCLYKTELPLINYTSYDQLDSYMRRGLRFARGVQGRMNDVIHHRDGSVTEWGNISGIVNYIPEIISYRIVQEDYENLTMMMVRNPDAPEERQDEIVKQLDEKLMAMFKDPSFKITYQWLDEIPADPNGKLRVIVSKVKPGAIGEPEHAGEDVGNAEITG